MTTTRSRRHPICSSTPCRPTSAPRRCARPSSSICSPRSATARDTVPAIAAQCKASERGTRILCDYLTIVGFLTKPDDRYQLTPDTTRLPEQALAGLPRRHDGVPRRAGQSSTTSTISPARSGAARSRRPTAPSSDENPVWEEFARAMMPMMMPPAQAIADILGVAAAGPIKVLDIAAGHGIFGIVDRAAQSAGGNRRGRLGRRAAGRDRERREDGRRRRATRRWPATRSRSTGAPATTSR